MLTKRKSRGWSLFSGMLRVKRSQNKVKNRKERESNIYWDIFEQSNVLWWYKGSKRTKCIIQCIRKVWQAWLMQLEWLLVVVIIHGRGLEFCRISSRLPGLLLLVSQLLPTDRERFCSAYSIYLFISMICCETWSQDVLCWNKQNKKYNAMIFKSRFYF